MALAETTRQRLVACDKYSGKNDTPIGGVDRIIEEYFQSVHASSVARLRWLIAKYDLPEDGFQDFVDAAWETFTDKGRRQAILIHSPDGYFACVHKSDQRKIALTVEGTQPDLYQLNVPTNRYDQPKFKIDVVAQLLEAADEYTVNMRLEDVCRSVGNAEEEQPAPIEDVYKEMSGATETELQLKFWEARQKKPKERTPSDRALLAGQAPYRAIKKEQAKRKREETVIFRVGDNATDLEYPRDVERLARKRGTTYNPLSERKEERLVSDYADTRLHLEKVLVLWGAGGRGKTQSARALAKYIAAGHGTDKYISTGNVDALKALQHEFAQYVPVILEDMSADDTSQHGRKLSANYLKHLLDVPDGGQCRIRNTNVSFCPRQPKILCINDTPQAWLAAVRGIKDSDQVPLERRLLFVEADEYLLDPKAVAAHEAVLDEVMQKFKQRRVEYEHSLDRSTPSTTAAGSSTAGTSDDEGREQSEEESPVGAPMTAPAAPVEAPATVKDMSFLANVAAKQLSCDEETLTELPEKDLHAILQKLDLDKTSHSKPALIHRILRRGCCVYDGCRNVAINVCPLCGDVQCGDFQCWVRGKCFDCDMKSKGGKGGADGKED